ncbi:MAG: hypothetical protein ABIH46_09620 [Chloroflexota bacterium]
MPTKPPRKRPPEVITPGYLAEKWSERGKNWKLALKDLEGLDPDKYDTSECEDLLEEYRDLDRSDYGDAIQYQEARDEAWQAFLDCLGDIEEEQDDEEDEDEGEYIATIYTETGHAYLGPDRDYDALLARAKQEIEDDAYPSPITNVYIYEYDPETSMPSETDPLWMWVRPIAEEELDLETPPIVVQIRPLVEKWTKAKARNVAVARDDVSSLDYDINPVLEALDKYANIFRRSFASKEDFDAARVDAWDAFLEELETLAEVQEDVERGEREEAEAAEAAARGRAAIQKARDVEEAEAKARAVHVRALEEAERVRVAKARAAEAEAKARAEKEPPVRPRAAKAPPPEAPTKPPAKPRAAKAPPVEPPEVPVRPTRGGFSRPFGLGQFIRAYLIGDDQYGITVDDPSRGAPTEDIRAAYKNQLLTDHAQELMSALFEQGKEITLAQALVRTPKRLTKIRSHSFYRYFHHLKMLGWVELTGEEEGSTLGGNPGALVEKTNRGTTLVEVPQPRRFYRLSAAGRAASYEEWNDPLQALYHYSKEQRSPKPLRLREVPK